VAEQEDVRGVDHDEEQIGGEQRNREPEDLAGRHPDLVDVQVLEQAVLPQGAEEHDAVEPDADGAGGHVSGCEEFDAGFPEHEEEDDRQPEPGSEHVPPEEDRTRLREDGEHPHEEPVQRLDGGQEDHDEEKRHGRRSLTRVPAIQPWNP
jgi:hypothetical protein